MQDQVIEDNEATIIYKYLKSKKGDSIAGRKKRMISAFPYSPFVA